MTRWVGSTLFITPLKPLGQFVERFKTIGEAPESELALNGRVVPREQWAATRIEKGDRIEIVRALRGG